MCICYAVKNKILSKSSFLRSFCLLLLLNSRVSATISISLRGGENPLGALLWQIQNPGPSSFFKRQSVGHFKVFSCSGRKDQLYPDLSSSCHHYYRCLDGVAYSYMCPDGEKFDFDTQECQPEEEIECLKVPPTFPKCWQQTDGFYPKYENGCKSYYSCFNGTLEEEEICEENTTWDTSTRSCGSGKNLGVCSAPSCLGIQEGFYPLYGSSCSAYYYCNNGLRTDMICPFGTQFDYRRNQCILKTYSACYDDACNGKVNGVHALEKAVCKEYFECFNGILRRSDWCPFMEIFDGESCVTRSNFTCTAEGKGSCNEKLDGLYPLEDSEDCSGFFYCRNQQVIRKFQCDPGMVFNGVKCIIPSDIIDISTNNMTLEKSSNLFRCVPKVPQPDCSKKDDGYFSVEKTGCTKFFRCGSQNIISEHTCPGYFVFNGFTCSDPLYYSCPEKNQNN